MTPVIIDGKAIAAKLIAELKPKIASMRERKFFGAALVGDNAASQNFLKQKHRVAQELGVDFRLYELPADITTDKLREEIARLAGAKTCGGFIVQLPLPERLENKHYILNAIPKQKDVDCLSEAALGAFYTGRSPVAPPSVATVEEILRETGRTNLRELTVAVIGAGALIGRPVGFWLQNRVGELMVFDSSVKNLREKLREADVVVSGTGVPGIFGAQNLKDGALVVDFGFNKTADGKMRGDFDPQSQIPNSKFQIPDIAYTPTPGGTGPILVAKLFENFYFLNRFP
jgi:methylenetetrahydrofolate dehydrogenase (NADP+)/methenyltetrahydrofolate cyclohydrolase